MKPNLKTRRGISTVLTTIIILVASVVLGSGVVVYGTSLFQGGTQQESISVQGVKMWVDPATTNQTSWGAAAMRNSGDKIVSVDKIQIRGTDVPFGNWYAETNPARVTTKNYQASFKHTGAYQPSTQLLANSDPSSTCTGVTGTAMAIDQDGAGGEPALCLIAQTGPITLNPGEKAIVYFLVPNGVLSSLDSGASTSLNIFAGKTGAPQTITVANP